MELIVKHEADIVAGKIPADIAKFQDFRGLIEVDKDTVWLKGGEYGYIDGCAHVDFVPNVFLGRVSTLRKTPWEGSLILGEHEEFFARLKETKPLILSCEYVETAHMQHEWWNKGNDDQYARMRHRVWYFFTQALRIHDRIQMNSFGSIPKQVQRLEEIWE